MKEYKVIALSVGGLNNKIFNSGDTVNDKQFVQGHAEKLVEQGFLKPLQPTKDVEVSEEINEVADIEKPVKITKSNTKK